MVLAHARNKAETLSHVPVSFHTATRLSPPTVDLHTRRPAADLHLPIRKAPNTLG